MGSSTVAAFLLARELSCKRYCWHFAVIICIFLIIILYLNDIVGSENFGWRLNIDAGITKITLNCLIIVWHQSRSAAKGTRANQHTTKYIQAPDQCHRKVSQDNGTFSHFGQLIDHPQTMCRPPGCQGLDLHQSEQLVQLVGVRTGKIRPKP